MCLTFGEGGGALGKVRHVSLLARFFLGRPLRGRREKKIWPKVRHCLTRGGRGLRGTDALSDFFFKKIKNYLKCLKCSKTCNKDIKLF